MRVRSGKGSCLVDKTITFFEALVVSWLLENHASMILMSDWNSTKSVGVEIGLNTVVRGPGYVCLGLHVILTQQIKTFKIYFNRKPVKVQPLLK